MGVPAKRHIPRPYLIAPAFGLEGPLWTPAVLAITVGVMVHLMAMVCLDLSGHVQFPVFASFVRIRPMEHGLYVGVVLWSLLAFRWVLPARTGSGFSLASLGVLMRGLAMWGPTMDLLAARTETQVPYPASTWLAIDLAGTVAYAFGMGRVLFETVDAIRHRPRPRGPLP